MAAMREMPCAVYPSVIFLEADLSQAESKVVFMLTGDPEMVRLARLNSWEWDGHTENVATAGLTRNMEETLELKRTNPKLFKQYRQVGKKTSHGAQRDMKGNRLSDTILKDLGIYTAPEKCAGYLENYHRKYPTIRGRYFRDIRRTVMRDKMLVNSWGRRIDFRYDRIEDELYRQAYSFLPQSEVADLLNQWGLIPTYYYLKALYNRPPNVQVHDSLLMSVQPSDAWDVADFVRKNLEKPRLYAGNTLVIPVEFKLGLNWGASEAKHEGIEFKRLPKRAEFTEVAWELEKRRLAA